ncbi:MAG: FecR domain-containing protein [Gemmatimonadaceae bacterium]
MFDELMDGKLARYVGGQSSDDEIREVHAWMHGDRERQARVESLERLWRASTETVTSRWDTAEAWKRVTQRIAQMKSAGPVLVLDNRDVPARTACPSLGRYRHATSTWGRFAMAAAVVIAAVGGVAIWQSSVRLSDTAPAVPLRDITTKRGQQADVYLSDGTHVILGVASHLRFPVTFGTRRDVYLTGEAYFDVEHDARRPFAVHTTRGVIKDLGTKFNVRAYTDGANRRLEVVVAQGVVALEPRAAVSPAHPTRSGTFENSIASTVVLRASDLARIDGNGDLSTRHGVDVASYLAWTHGELVFRNVPMRDVLPVLTRWYDADLRVGDSTLAAYPITATLTGERFEGVVDLLASALNARVEHRGAAIVFKRRQ